MKKQTTHSPSRAVVRLGAGVTMIFLMTAGAAYAQVNGEASVEGELNTGGGLGNGISHMVRTILGETIENEASESQTEGTRMLKSSDAAPATMMMQADLSAGVESANQFSAAEAAADVSAHLITLQTNDERVESLAATENSVHITYIVDARVFRIVPVKTWITAEVLASGDTRVSYPWYAFAVSGMSADFKSRFAQRMTPYLDGEAFSESTQIMLASEIHAALSAEFDASRE